MSDIERKAVVLLAKKYSAGGFSTDAERIREGDLDRLERQAVQAIIAALTPAEGYVLVPVEPTDRMIGEGILAYDGKCESTYAAMIAARPEVK